MQIERPDLNNAFHKNDTFEKNAFEVLKCYNSKYTSAIDFGFLVKKLLFIVKFADDCSRATRNVSLSSQQSVM